MGKFLKHNIVSALAITIALGAATLPASAATLRMAWSQDATGLDPHKQTAFSSIRLLELVYEPLLRTDSDLNLAPAVAKSWAFSDDGKTLTFKLDPNAKFSDGSPVTPADVKASFTRILDEATGASARSNFLSIESIDTPDDETVVFNLSQPDVPLLTAMASINAAIVPAKAIADGTIGTAALGSGPFELKDWEPNAKEVLVENPNWAGGKTGVDEIDISVLPDETAILAALRTDQVDFALINDPLVATLVPKEKNLTLNREPVLSYHVLQLNADRGAMQDVKVRQAISCAVDRQDVLDAALLGEGKVTGPLTMPAYASDPSTLFCYTPDLDKAKQLMAESSSPDGFDAKVIVATGEPPTAIAEAQVLQSQLAKIGIKLDIESMELNVYVDRWLKGDFDMAVALNGGRTDPYTMYNRYWTKAGNLQKVAHYIDDDLDNLMQEGRVETDPAKRKAIFAEFSKHITEVSPWIWLYTGYSYTAQQNSVEGFVADPTGSLFGLTKVTVSK
ncbi:ABC transporter substrate-binding protein [Martelella alba]|uniref:ABC transporter substrate-binding protein n=1 Tax=Martelella alba TaxID=2590451 RepID=A0A506UJ74_9HYPH|nr:ABC transporter substrate-binding protein [Martelella alba]TPW33384.1 ABC transporter substrate-binding protein [Martelella alba]